MKLLADGSTAKTREALFSAEEKERLQAPEALMGDLGKLAGLLADETRLRVLYYLTQRDELHVRALCELLGESQPAVSHHLALLRDAGVIERRRQGKHNFYYLQYHRLSGLLDLLFAALPEGNRRLRFDDYILSHSPAPADASRSDASRSDASRSDASRSDGARGDSGRGDSGRTDSGRTDSGRTDSGRTDSGRTDDIVSEAP